MNRKSIPLLLMLFAGAMTSIVVYSRQLGIVWMLIATLAVMVVFYLIGSIIKLILDSLDEPEKTKPKVSVDGEVIEKGAAEGELSVENSETI